MSDESQLPATVPSKPPVVRKKRERLMTQEEMRACAQGAGLDEAVAGQWNALTEIGRALAQMGKRNCGTGMTMKSHRFFEQQLEDVEKRLKDCKDDDAIIRLEMIRMELITRMGTLGNNLTTQADKEPKPPDEPAKEVTKSFPVHPPIQVNISTQPSSDVKILSNGSHLGADSEPADS